ncbi:hypothetical protein CHS0354_024334 [Potamilus streckersoni]|uniref:Sulfotransferase domain-containing protein n=1 Tax=Potamilus streckersoni TaxID=2493646 RepID=A0AAE0W4D3_9BIVA|nr:hypothetical protein CHS0354_024334 [Potamilus streckersoni]
MSRQNWRIKCFRFNAGTHWIWEVLNMLISGKAEYVPWTPDRDFLEIEGEKIEQIPSPKIIITHYSINDLPKDVFKKRVKIVHVSRNPKSVAVSMYHHMKAERLLGDIFPETFSEFLPLFLDEENYMMSYWFSYIQDVETFCRENPENPVFNIKYEEIKKNQHIEIKRLAQFLEIETSDSLVDEIISKCEISKLKTVRGDEKDGGRPAMYRKGIVSDWKNWFTVADNEAFDKVYEEKMSSSKFTFEY